MSLSPNNFPYIEDYLSKFKTLILLLKECEIDNKDDRCIYVILAKIGTTYSMFVTTFYSTREYIGDSYQKPSLESFCDPLIKEKEKLLHLGVINTAGVCNKDFLTPQKDRTKHKKIASSQQQKVKQGSQTLSTRFYPRW